MYIMDLLTADNRCPELADALDEKQVKLARHVLGSDRLSIKHWIGSDPRKFDVWQGRQKMDQKVFHKCKFVVSFLADSGTQAKFVGVYRNISRDNPRWFQDVVDEGGLAAELEEVTPNELRHPEHCFYELCRMPGFSDLENLVKIEWANPGKKSGRIFYQLAHKNPKLVVESP